MDIIELDFQKLRLDRQNNNISNVNNLLKNKDIKELYKNINKKQLDLILKTFEWDINKLLDKCENDHYFSHLLSFHISKNSSRQGSFDENKQIEICSKYCSLYNINFYKLKEHYYCLENGDISKNKKYKIYNSVKSFDASFEYKNIKFYISCKVVFNNGGHQDNVFKELHSLLDWVKDMYNIKNNYKFIILIETNLYKKLEKLENEIKKIDKILYLFNHIEFQNFIKYQLINEEVV